MPEEFDGIRYLIVEDLIAINSWLIQSQTPSEPIAVIKPNELWSAQQKPANYRCYEQTEDLIILASVLIAGLVDNHCFANANKRTAAAAAAVFLRLNGYELTAPDHELVDQIDGYVRRMIPLDRLQDWIAYWTHESPAHVLEDTDAFARMESRFYGVSLAPLNTTAGVAACCPEDLNGGRDLKRPA